MAPCMVRLLLLLYDVRLCLWKKSISMSRVEWEFSQSITFQPLCVSDVGYLKKHCETVVGVVSQCCLTKHVNKQSNKQYLANVALKINVKVDRCFLWCWLQNHSGCVGILFPNAVEVWMFCSGLWIDWSFPSIYLSVDSYRQYLLTWVATKKFAWNSLFARLVDETLFWLMLSQGEFLWWVISPLSSLVQMWHTHIQERIPSLQLLRYINLSPFAPKPACE